jgi:hypothetical protein
MTRTLILAIAIALLLPGCGTLARFHKKDASTLDQALLDQQLLSAARSIAQTQAELRSMAAVSNPPGQGSPRSLAAPVGSSKPITVQWDGDASDLARILATQAGLKFEARGVKVPIPVNVTAVKQPYDDVMAEFLAQLDYRASVYKLPGRLVLEYTPTTGMVH